MVDWRTMSNAAGGNGRSAAFRHSSVTPGGRRARALRCGVGPGCGGEVIGHRDTLFEPAWTLQQLCYMSATMRVTDVADVRRPFEADGSACATVVASTQPRGLTPAPLRRRWRVTSWQGICQVLPTAPSMKRFRARPLSLLAVISACHAENPVRPPPIGVDTVAMSSPTASLPLGQTAQLIATPMDARGHVLAGRTIAWSSSDSSVAIVSTAGLASNTSGFVTSVGLGTATISAATEGKRGTTLVSVTQPAAGVSHYVDAVAGNDTNPGTSAAPWQTI